MAARERWQLVATTDLWFKQGAATPTAAAASGSVYLRAGELAYIDGTLGPKLSIIQATTGGSACLAKVRPL